MIVLPAELLLSSPVAVYPEQSRRALFIVQFIAQQFQLLSFGWAT